MKEWIVCGRNWDKFDGYLFDIDGTLLNCQDAVHYFAFCGALRNLSGRELTLEGVNAHGNTDVGILRDALTLAQVGEEHWRPRLAEVRSAMGDFVQQRRGEFRIAVLPAVHAVLNHLRAKGALLGVATGNLQRIGEVKLELAGLLSYFSVGAWSDAFEYRHDVFRSAIAAMQVHAGKPREKKHALCVVGDTPSDIEAARANDLPVIAVATGVYSLAQLEACGPDLCLPSLACLLSEE